MPLSRADMERIITQEGGSVLLPDGRLVTRVEHLPSEAALAKGDPEKERQAAANLHQQIADMQAQLDALTAAQQPAGDVTPNTGAPVTPPEQPDDKGAKKKA